MIKSARHTSWTNREKCTRTSRVSSLRSLLLYQRDKSIAEKGATLSETLKTKRQPWRYDEPQSKQCCLVSVHNAVTTGPDAFTNEDGSCIMTQVGFNSLFAKRARSWGREIYCEVNSIYNKAQRCGFDLLLQRVVAFPVLAYENSGGSSHNSTGK